MKGEEEGREGSNGWRVDEKLTYLLIHAQVQLKSLGYWVTETKLRLL